MSGPNRITLRTAGLSDNAMGGLAYIIIIPAIVIPLIKSCNKNSNIRFHAWQFILLAIAWIVIDIALGIFGLIGTCYQLINVGLYSLVALAVLILWLIALIKALNGERYKLPIKGDFAEKLVGA